MFLNKLTIGAVALLATVAISYGGKYSGDKVLRISPATDLQVKLLIDLEEKEPLKYDFWKLPGGIGKATDIHIKAQDYTNFTSYLYSKKMKYKILSQDLQTLMDQQNDHPHYADASGESWFLKYHPFDEIENKINDIVRKHSNNAELVLIGKSYNGNDQLAIKISGAPKKRNPVIFINCGIHAREWVGPATCMYMVEQLATKYGVDPTITATLDKLDFIILPVLNADGYEYSWNEDRFWRKNRRPINKECNGVDLNRNFPYKWGEDVEGAASSNPCSEIYRGTGPESELEVKNVANYLRALGETLKAYIDIHSYSQMWMLPWGYKTDAPNDKFDLMHVGKAGVQGIKAKMGTKYRLNSSSKLLYKTTGSTKDFTYGELGVKYSYVLELRDTGDRGFLLPESQILPTAMETLAGIKAMVAEMEDYSEEW